MISNALDLSGKRILIAGAGGALGSAAARCCAALGADLILTDIAAPEEVVRELRKAGASAQGHALDNRSRSQVDNLVAGLGELTAFADCSGVYRPGDWMKDDDVWDTLCREVIDVNVMGPINLMRAVLPVMMDKGRGNIVLTSSLAARNAGTTTAVDPSYIASKGSIVSLVRYFARIGASRGVIVNGVAPGPIETPMTLGSGQPFDVERLPLRRLGKPEEIGWPVAFLCSPGAGYMTGTIIDINGGLHFS